MLTRRSITVCTAIMSGALVACSDDSAPSNAASASATATESQNGDAGEPTAMAAAVGVPTMKKFRSGRKPGDRGPGEGGYGPVHTQQLLGDHTCWATGTSGNRFRWIFTEDHRFEFHEAGEPLPPELLETMLGGDACAELIEGTWDFTDGTLTFSQIRADGVDGWPDVSLRPFRTPVVRMVIGGVQYVLGGRVEPRTPQPLE